MEILCYVGVKKQSDASAAGRNLWVSGLLPTTRAADLKALFSKYGKVFYDCSNLV